VLREADSKNRSRARNVFTRGTEDVEQIKGLEAWDDRIERVHGGIQMLAGDMVENSVGILPPDNRPLCVVMHSNDFLIIPITTNDNFSLSSSFSAYYVQTRILYRLLAHCYFSKTT
jgi:hypothetical protein